MFKKKSLTASSLGLRIVMGGYLLYLAYSLIPSIRTAVDTKEMILCGAFAALFLGVGIIVLFFSVKALIKGEYDKGTDSDSSNEQDMSNEIEMNEKKEKKEENRTDEKEN